MLSTTFTLILLLLSGSQGQSQQLQNDSQCQGSISCEQFEYLQKEVTSLQAELNYWQNMTINILKKYLLDNEGTGPNHCTASDDSHKDRLEKIDHKIESIHNTTQGYKIYLENINDKLANVDSQFSTKITNIEQEISTLSHPPLGSFLNPAPSCKFIPQGSPSGHYWIQNAGTGYANLEYCDMTRRCCNSTGGWMRVAHLDMTDTNQQCPSGFRLITSPKRTCGTPGSRCVSTTFHLRKVKYSRVCGKIIGYQSFSPDAFCPYYFDRSRTIDDQYVDGVSLTHGQRPRKHIWTFAGANDEIRSNKKVCPCTKNNTYYTGVVPPFIGQDYFCDTGSRYNRINQFYHADPLWDGSGCGPTSSCCAFNNPPWFCKQLPQQTTDNIEMRVCTDEAISNEYIALESAEIYVQ